MRPDELDILYPACVAMFTEEVGISPANGDGGSLYRARVGELIGQGRAFARIEDGRVVFKAEVGAATQEACQIQGVWVDPALRGRGYANGGMAAVVAQAQASVAPGREPVRERLQHRRAGGLHAGSASSRSAASCRCSSSARQICDSPQGE